MSESRVLSLLCVDSLKKLMFPWGIVLISVIYCPGNPFEFLLIYKTRNNWRLTKGVGTKRSRYQVLVRI